MKHFTSLPVPTQAKILRAGWYLFFLSTAIVILTAATGSEILSGGGVATIPLWAVGIIVAGIVAMNHLSRKLGEIEAKSQVWDKAADDTQKLAQNLAVVSSELSRLTSAQSNIVQLLHETALLLERNKNEEQK